MAALIRCSQMDKATLLAEVINQVKVLNEMEASKVYLIPMDDDEVKVEPHSDAAVEGTFLFKASICCDYRLELVSDVKQALDTLPLKIVNVEISTLGGRLKNLFVFSSCKQGNIDNGVASQLLANAVHQALSSILDRAFSIAGILTTNNTAEQEAEDPFFRFLELIFLRAWILLG
ncbi:transcription factor bHLH51-like [Mangifera indica]|uniref:transcription factor bHLH51-like n=1 Tax=Mangifera indica TaxID=29780 RepID=UPI001CFA5C43|nr:transcription factor bHLH51-like [Mangifera indica]